MSIKERIQQKASELIMRYGIRSVTMDEIALQLGISKKTIYQFYSDKEALVKDIFKTITDENKLKCMQFKDIAENAIHEQYLAAEAAHEIFNNMNTSVLYDLNRFHPNVFAEFEQFKKQFLFNSIKENIQRGIKEGLFRKDINVNIITWLRLEMISGIFHNEEVLTGKMMPYKFENEMKDFFLHGICTEKGLSIIAKYKHQRQKKISMSLLKSMLLIISLFFLSHAFSQQPVAMHAFSLQQCLDYAQKNNATVKNALLDVKIQEQQNRAVTAAAYPQVNGSFNTQFNPNVTVQTFPNFIAAATYGVLEAEGVKNGSGNPITSPSDFGFIEAAFGTKWTANAGLTLSQILFDGQVFVGLQARKTSIDYRQQSVEITEQLIRTNISKVYYQLSVAAIQVNLLDANITRTDKQLNDSREMYKNGFAEKLDVDKASVQLTNLQSQRQTTINAVENGYLGLKLLMGMPIKDSLALTDTITAETIKQGALLENAYKYEDRPDFRSLTAYGKLQDFNVRRYKLSRLPTAKLNAGYSRLSQSNKFDFFSGAPWFTSSYIGLTIDIPLLGGFLKDANIKQAQLQQEQVNNNLENLRLQIDEEVDSSIISFNNAVINIDIQQKNVDLATEVYDLTKKKYESGLASSTDISNAQVDLTTAQNNYVLALYSAALAKIDYLKATGKL